MYKLYCRIYQRTFQLFSKFLPWRKPFLLDGVDSLLRLPELLKRERITKVLIVTDAVIESIGLMNRLKEKLKEEGISYFIYDKTVPNPTVDNIEEAFHMYQMHDCEGIIAFGGGSPIDCAKGAACRIARPNMTIRQMRGLLKVRRKLPMLIAIPTTAGTGSEATVAVVICEPATHEKYAIYDPVVIPKFAVLDPVITVGLPAHITSTTGMDALTHAVEAYIGKNNTKETQKLAIMAVKLIFNNIYKVYNDGGNLKARGNMQKASYYAGVAFTRAYVGYVHAVAHTLGGFYNIPHGLANAVILPYVLELYGTSVHKRLAELADAVGITELGDTTRDKANKFIDEIKTLNKKMNIPNKIDNIEDKDIPLMVGRALKESNPLYPVPKIMGKKEIEKIYHMIQA